MAKKFLFAYRVVRTHHESCELRAANDELIGTHGIVDLQVRFRSGESSKPKARVLTRCIVADIPFNVMSPYVLVAHGWECRLAVGRKSCLVFGDLERGGQSIPLELDDRSWWANASMDTYAGNTPRGSPRGPKGC